VKSIYEQAIADAKKLKEIAEANATNKIIEAVTPKIRRLIEQELEGDELVDDDMEDLIDDQDDLDDLDDDDLDDDIDDEMDDLDDELDMEDEAYDPGGDYGSDVEFNLDGMSDDLGMEDAGSDYDMDVDFSANDEPISVDTDMSMPDSDSGKNVTFNITVEQAANKNLKHLSGRKRYKLMKDRAGFLIAKLAESKNRRQQKKILSELAKIKKQLILINNGTKTVLTEGISKLLKESNMNRRNRRRSRLNENAWWLFEAEGDEKEAEEAEAGFDDEEEGGDEEDFDMDDEDMGEDEEIDVDVDAIKSAVEDLAAAVGLEVDEGGADDEDMDFGDDEDMDFDDEDFGDDDADADDADDADADEGYMAEEDEKEVVEISESMLRRELRKMNESKRRRRRTPRRRRRLRESEAKDAASSFGGGKAEKDMFVDVSEESLLNALAEELGDAHDMTINSEHAEGGADKMVGHFGGGSIQKGVVPEARLRRERRRARIAERKAIAAKKELRESNLFNAKLLYVNKLLQNHNLSKKQQRAIVEALDNAKTVREAKLLFTSLTESLQRRNTKGSARRLSEGRIIGSGSSKSVRSGSPAKIGTELDRWQVLAGIKK